MSGDIAALRALAERLAAVPGPIPAHPDGEPLADAFAAAAGCEGVRSSREDTDLVGLWALHVLLGGVFAVGAAVALVEHLLPGWSWSMDTHSGPSASVNLCTGDGWVSHVCPAPTPGLALLRALVAAKIAQAGTDHG